MTKRFAVVEDRSEPEDDQGDRGKSKIGLIRPDGQTLAGDTFSRVLASSDPGAWSDLVVEQHRCPASELSGFAYQQHVVVLNVGGPLTCEYKRDGRWKYARKEPGAVSFFPRHGFFTRRMRVTAEVVCLALEPTFFTRNVSEEIPCSPEFVEQRREADPVLFHLGLALQQASKTELRNDLLFGSSVSLALARHLLLKYSSQQTRTVSRASGGLAPSLLRKAQEFIRAHMQAGMTVPEIANAVHMSPFHFSRLFKKATGQSPYRYVTNLRMHLAKEKLLHGSRSLKELAYDLGFADQSHFSRQFKRSFGVTPQACLKSRRSLMGD